MLCEMLCLLQHDAYPAASAEDAVELLESRKFDLLLADINLPGMSGIDLAKIAVRHTPGIKIIFASGFGYLVADKTEFEFMLLPKPYGLAQLQHSLETAFPAQPSDKA